MLADGRRVDVTANHTDAVLRPGILRDHVFEAADEVRRLLDLPLDRCRQRPVAKPQRPADEVEPLVEQQQEVVADITDHREPAAVADHGIKLVAVHDEQLAVVGRHVDELVGDLDATQVVDEVPQELVVISGRVEHLRPAANQFNKPAENEAVGVVPVPGALQPPAVDEVADDVEVLGLDAVDEVEKRLGVSELTAQMNIADEDGSHLPHVQIPPLAQLSNTGPPRHAGQGDRSCKAAGTVVPRSACLVLIRRSCCN